MTIRSISYPYWNPWNATYVEKLAADYIRDPDSLDMTWRAFFDGMTLAQTRDGNEPLGLDGADVQFELKVIELMEAYRELGYLIADVNPLSEAPETHPLLELKRFELQSGDLDRQTRAGKLLGLGSATLRDIIKTLRQFYTQHIAVEYGHVDDVKARQWIQGKIEREFSQERLTKAERTRIFQKLTEAEAFEHFLHRKFVGQKRFSIEGCDVLIPMLDELVERAGAQGINEIIIGMSHRGRLNVLAHIFQRDLKGILAEFAGNLDANVGDGDVKYHMGYSHNLETDEGRKIHLSLLPNPSHLEAINPVLLGITRAKQRIKEDHERRQTLAVMIHGDAGFSGQGVVYEILNLSELKGYTVGGVIHIIVNNQLGYTADPSECRSMPHATDIGKILEIPAIRINADVPDVSLKAMRMAFDYRQAFHRDVVLDLIGYRRYGHNEGDEPSYTQPLMYRQIKAHPRVRELYSRQLEKEGVLSAADMDSMLQEATARMEAAYEKSQEKKLVAGMHAFGDRWKDLQAPTQETIGESVDTTVEADRLKDLAGKLLTVPESFHLHRKLKRSLDERREMVTGDKPLDWAMVEMLCYATLLVEDRPVRLVGQDTVRGTFSHRHAIFYDVENGQAYCALNHLSESQAKIEVVNSPLSEYAALGFEMGQSWAAPKQLTIWEAQFGDFVNGGQVILDQFLSSAAYKWQRHSGLVLYLPHGYEGQGPEHSSARLERFLQSCAQFNLQVCNLTKPAQLFHVLRRQLLRSFRIPLVLMTPKSLLRHSKVVSTFEDLSNGAFHEVFDDPVASKKPGKVKKIVLCSGKIYYDLTDARDEDKAAPMALIRVEQLYPFPKHALEHILSAYSTSEQIIWCQEEPRNMGAWQFMDSQFRKTLEGRWTLDYVGRAEQASTADAYLHLHKQEQERIMKEVFSK